MDITVSLLLLRVGMNRLFLVLADRKPLDLGFQKLISRVTKKLFSFSFFPYFFFSFFGREVLGNIEMLGGRLQLHSRFCEDDECGCHRLLFAAGRKLGRQWTVEWLKFFPYRPMWTVSLECYFCNTTSKTDQLQR